MIHIEGHSPRSNRSVKVALYSDRNPACAGCCRGNRGNLVAGTQGRPKMIGLISKLSADDTAQKRCGVNVHIELFWVFEQTGESRQCICSADGYFPGDIPDTIFVNYRTAAGNTRVNKHRSIDSDLLVMNVQAGKGLGAGEVVVKIESRG